MPLGYTSFQAALQSSVELSACSTQPSRSHILSVACFHWTRRVTIQASLHSGSRIRYGLRALRQAPRLPLSHFAHQSARLRSLSAVALNSLGSRIFISYFKSYFPAVIRVNRSFFRFNINKFSVLLCLCFIII